MEDLLPAPTEPAKTAYNEPPEGGAPLAREWQKRVTAARKKWEKFHKRVKHNRALVAGFDWTKDPTGTDFYKLRANLIHGTITAILPNIYARNPEMSVTPQHAGRDLKLLCKTVEKVTNRQLEDARLKKRAKAAVRAALTCSYGVVKVMYQRDINEDPIIKSRIQDTQDNIKEVEALLLQLEDPQQRGDQERIKAELEETLAALNEQAEVVTAEGLVIDRVLTEHVLLDESLAEFDDYADGDYMIHVIPMRKSAAEGLYKYKLDKATAYTSTGADSSTGGKIMSGEKGGSDGDCQICILEIWDKRSQRVYTMADGCDFFLKPPYSPPTAGERWYPFFLLPFQLVDGSVIGPSLVDLTERLQSEHNEIRDKEKRHRDAIKPGWIGDRGTLTQNDVELLQNAVENEITLLDAQGKAIGQAVMPKTYAPVDQALYDTSKVRYDWEQVSGMQDAARSTVVNPKTATEASIMNQALSGRVSEFRDQVEDWLQEISQYAAQILLQELTEPQVERIMGPHKTGPIPGPDGNPILDPATMQPVNGVIEPAYDWPQLSKDEVFDLIQLSIRAGTTGEPDKMEQQEVMIKLVPVIQPIIQQIRAIQSAGQDAGAEIALLKEIVARFDEKMDVEALIPQKPPTPPMMPTMPGAPMQPAAMPGVPAQGVMQ